MKNQTWLCLRTNVVEEDDDDSLLVEPPCQEVEQELVVTVPGDLVIEEPAGSQAKEKHHRGHQHGQYDVDSEHY